MAGTGLKLSPATFIFGRETPLAAADAETSFSGAKVSLGGHLGGRDGTADGRHHDAFKIERTEGPALYGDYLYVFQDNGNDFNLEIGLFGYYEVGWSGHVGVHYFGDLDPNTRLHFSRAECAAAERLIRQFFADPANILRYSSSARFLGRTDFRPDWIIESSQEFNDFEHWSAQDLVAAKSSTSRPVTRFWGARVGFGGAIFGSDKRMHTLFEVERNLETQAEAPVLYGEYAVVFPNPDLPNAFNIEINAFGYAQPAHVSDIELRQKFAANECADLEFFIRSFFSNPAIFRNDRAINARFLGEVTFAPGWIKGN
jgi:hypothetical protein